MRRYAGVIGWPVEHSLSPAIHNAAYAAAGLDAVYLAMPVRPDRLAEALGGVRALGFMGVNVTVPHKQAALALCDQIDDAARRVGAVNTIVCVDGQLRGTNTDVDGFRMSIEEKLGQIGLAPQRAVLLGSGGAARAVLAVLCDLGIPTVVVARYAARAHELVQMGAAGELPWTVDGLAAALDGAQLVVDATSTGLDEAREQAVPATVPLGRLAPGGLVCSLVYHREPAILRDAHGFDLEVLDGAGMLVYQAARAFTLMTGAPAPIPAMFVAMKRGY